MEKICNKCKESKPIGEFRKVKVFPDGHAYDCRDCHNESNRYYAQFHKDQKALTNRKWKENNRDEWRKRHAKAQRIRNAKRLPQDVIANGVRSKVHRQLTMGKYGKRTFDLLGYSVEDLMAHLEKQFKPGMSWDNYGEWHIDHIIPKVAFNVSSYDDFDFKRCWALKNLQPLWARENHMKRDKLQRPFQPALSIGVAG